MTRLAFVLPVRGGAGSAHSVVQEVSAMRDLGVEARILVNAANAEGFRENHARFDWVLDGGVGVFDGPQELGRLIAGEGAVVATTASSVHCIARAAETLQGPAFRTGYCVQDYEPLFHPEGSMEQDKALASFSLLRGCTYIARSNWLAEIVHSAHGHAAALVVPSIDHGLFGPARRAEGAALRVVAMVRPGTPRRAPLRTLRLLGRLAAGAFGPVEAIGFGASGEELAALGMEPPAGVTLTGRLSQAGVAGLLREADAFLDLSDFQAFGRTAAEAMACGCLPLAPRLGGTVDFLEDGVSGFLADTSDEASVDAALRRLLSLSESERRRMRLAALDAVADFTPVRAAISELRALGLG
ncbi:glycosyltransferase [Roseococcus sp. SYP-B2431]|uniref:glycosyltransferase family 4 protein n=1 Tax=Roseococcus sp. SYP-B2431 TaxID=2496640 RepID=UPI0010399E32|nr:glycosyltransferase family 4 protein [Roseococcus sp. SYP-B2431]TCH96752.1 glycosyltransferase [Roseococcus sp. SYP-B2431]